MKTVNVKTTSVLISILLHTEDCVYRAVSKRCLFSLRVKNSHCIQKKKKKSIKIQRLFWKICSPWIPTRFSWEPGQSLGWVMGMKGGAQGGMNGVREPALHRTGKLSAPVPLSSVAAGREGGGCFAVRGPGARMGAGETGQTCRETQAVAPVIQQVLEDSPSSHATQGPDGDTAGR